MWLYATPTNHVVVVVEEDEVNKKAKARVQAKEKARVTSFHEVALPRGPSADPSREDQPAPKKPRGHVEGLDTNPADWQETLKDRPFLKNFPLPGIHRHGFSAWKLWLNTLLPIW
jgi:hypothetical protein